MKLTYSRSIYFCAIIWGMIGLRILSKGILFLSLAHQNNDFLNQSLSISKESFFSIVISLSLFIGWIKGKFILTKSADRMVRHIVSFDEPLYWKELFPKSFFFVMLGMMFIGISLKYLPIPFLIKGVIDITISTALIYGSWYFFRKGRAIYNALKNL